MATEKFSFMTCLQQAKLNGCISKFKSKSPLIALWCEEQKWLPYCTAYIEYDGKYSVEQIFGHMTHFTFMDEWRNAYPNEYRFVLEQGWLKFSSLQYKRVSLSDSDVIKAAKAYRDINDLYKADRKLYKTIMRKTKITKRCIAHMTQQTLINYEPKTFEECVDSAKLSSNLGIWKNIQPDYYRAASANEWLHRIIKIMNWETRDDSHIKEKILASAKKYKHKSDWLLNENSLYALSKYYGLFSEATAHMKAKVQPKKRKVRELTKEVCHSIALAYETRTAFFRGDPSAYGVSRKYKWLDEICAHMKKRTFSLDECIEVAGKYRSNSAWKRGDSPSYLCAKRQNWFFDIATALFRQQNMPVFSKKYCEASAMMFTDAAAWKTAVPDVYKFSYRADLIGEVSTLFTSTEKNRQKEIRVAA